MDTTKLVEICNKSLIFKGHIDDGKRIAEHLRELSIEAGMDLETVVNDFVFALECEYQLAYGLDEDDWELNHTLALNQ